MNLDSVKKRIESFLASNKRWPVVVDFLNRDDMDLFVEHFRVGENNILSAGEFCGKDGTLKFEEISNTIETNAGNIFVAYLTAFLKLQGENDARNTLKSILSKSVCGHVVLVTYQCRNYLKFSDSRFSERGQIYLIDGTPDEEKHICLISPDLKDAFPGSYDGFETIGEAFERGADSTVYVATDVSRDLFGKSTINITQLNSGYDVLCDKDPIVKMVPSSFGTPQQWNYLLKAMGKDDFNAAIETQFGSAFGLEDGIKQYPSYSSNRQWMYFIALSILGAKKSQYLQQAVFNAANYSEFIKSIFRTILTTDRTDPDFWKLYKERKEILPFFSNMLDEVVDFCKVVSVKEEDAIYYLTDLTQPEKEKVIEWLDMYGEHYSQNDLIAIMEKVYPDLAAYLSTYRFKKPLLDDYFESYKYQKVINRILPSFEAIVDEQAHELGFVDNLQPRTTIVDKLDFNNAHGYFFDALGVEYLGYIQTKCNEYGLSTNITCGRCELPSLTSFNKDFLDTCMAHGCPVSDIKTLDEIKHHGEDSFDYEKVKKPVYLIRELEIIDQLLKKVRANILGGLYEKAIIFSDHGASRLADLHETENTWSMATKGVHSGRCCPKNDVNSKPDFAIDADEYWVLANYDRFRGSRKANVEVHGGATLEEVTVPIIEITKKMDHVEAFVIDGSKILTLSAKEHPVIKIYVGLKSNSISIRLNGQYYDAEQTTENYIYRVELPDCTKKGIYTFDILNGADVLTSENSFEVKKKGLSEVSLFD